MLYRALATFGSLLLLLTHTVPALAEETPGYDLTARLQPGDSTRVAVTLNVGGELLTRSATGKEVKLPISAVADFEFDEQLIGWELGEDPAARALRRYLRAKATIKVDEAGEERTLPEPSRLVVAALEAGRYSFNGLETPLDRDQLDLIRVVADPLALDRLLPNRKVAQGSDWEHQAPDIAALLGLDHVAMCDVRSTVVGAERNQVKLKLAGTATGSIEGTTTEVELRAAYLYHIDHGRITKFNLAVKERRKVGEVTPGLDVIAKLSLTAKPIVPTAEVFSQEEMAQAAAWSTAEIRQLAFQSPERGCRFRHDDDWYVTAVQPDLLALRLLFDGDLLAHCNIRTLPVRISSENGPTLEEFETDIRRALGDKLTEISSATQWKSPADNDCLGVFADGEIDGVPMQWRYYLISAEGKPQISLSVTVEKSNLELFADADRGLVDSLELLDKPARTASKSDEEVGGR